MKRWEISIVLGFLLFNWIRDWRLKWSVEWRELIYVVLYRMIIPLRLG